MSELAEQTVAKQRDEGSRTSLEGMDDAERSHSRRSRQSRNHERTPVLAGTRVPFQTLIDYLEAGHSLSEILDDFPTVAEAQALAALKQANDVLPSRARSA